MNFFSSFVKSTTEQVNNLGKCATDVIDSIATFSTGHVSSPPLQSPPDENASSEQESSASISSDDANDESDISKVISSAKNLGSIVTKSTLSFGSNVLKKGKEMVTLLESTALAQELTSKQVDLLKDVKNNEKVISLWVGMDVKEEEVKKKILTLSSDRRNFLRPPPCEFEFNLETSAPVAIALLIEDKSLKEMRYLLVPKEINEESFWRNYFYRISLIKMEASMDNFFETFNDDDKIPDGIQFANLNIDTEETLEMVNDLANFELDVAESIDEDEINLELSDFNLLVD